MCTDCFNVYTSGKGGDCEGLETTGTRKYIEADFVVKEQPFNLNSGNVYFEKNMAEVAIVAESVLNKYNTEIYISISPENSWTGCSYNETNEILSMDNITSLINVTAFGVFNHAKAGVTAHCTYDVDKDKYTVEYIYYIIDFYDFSFYEALNEMNALGLSRAYELYGVVSGSMIWNKDWDFIIYEK